MTENDNKTTPTSATQKRIAILQEVKKRASEKGDFALFARVSQDIRTLEREIEEYEGIYSK